MSSGLISLPDEMIKQFSDFADSDEKLTDKVLKVSILTFDALLQHVKSVVDRIEEATERHDLAPWVQKQIAIGFISMIGIGIILTVRTISHLGFDLYKKAVNFFAALRNLDDELEVILDTMTF